MNSHVFEQIAMMCQESESLKERVCVLSADTSRSVKTEICTKSLGVFSRHNPRAGLFTLPLTENLMVGMAEGLAVENYFPVIGIYESFLRIVIEELDSLCRSLDTSTQGMMVVATHAGFTCSDGRGIQSVGLPSTLAVMPKLTYWEPASCADARELTRSIIGRRRGIHVLRCPRADYCYPMTPETVCVLGSGGSAAYMRPQVRDPRGILIICNGSLLREAVQAAQECRCAGVEAAIVCVRCRHLSEYERGLFRAWLRRSRAVVTVHDSFGGYLEHWMYDTLGNVEARGIQVRHLEAKGYGQSGRYAKLLSDQGLDGDAITQAILEVHDETSP
jgi:transketolase C-terminal domain/subunit